MTKKQHSPFVRAVRRLSLSLSFVILVVLFLLVVLWQSIVYTTPVGHQSVLWHRLATSDGSNSVGPLGEGLHLIWPWDEFYTYDLRLQTHHNNYQVVSNDGLHFDISLTFRWRLIGENIVSLNDNIGPEYVEKVLVPEIGSVTRAVIAQFNAEALVTEGRSDVQSKIYAGVTSPDLPNGILGRRTPEPDELGLILLTDVLIRRVALPTQIKQAIENKLEQAQVVEEYAFRVQREGLEKQRKEIEAEGIRNFQNTIAPAISESYLKWRGIEATLRLAESENAKIVIFGNSDDGLPVILDMETPDDPRMFAPIEPRPEQPVDEAATETEPSDKP
ncbi:prohibitin family protein [uncultured Tateyamaria sp.]|uniref:prohibitin family protein n=1 Tax=uncultured Tateyamaria sp. TaxID=455651 RepID=UPI00261C75B6|nr:prohibitin family protein [uncultured Tateyamaria sp.]